MPSDRKVSVFCAHDKSEFDQLAKEAQEQAHIDV